jgi:hypothetical protein
MPGVLARRGQCATLLVCMHAGLHVSACWMRAACLACMQCKLVRRSMPPGVRLIPGGMRAAGHVGHVCRGALLSCFCMAARCAGAGAAGHAGGRAGGVPHLLAHDVRQPGAAELQRTQRQPALAGPVHGARPFFPLENDKTCIRDSTKQWVLPLQSPLPLSLPCA